MTREALRELLEDQALGRIADEVSMLAADCVRFQAIPVDESSIAHGTSKMGGSPDLPRSVPWPRLQDGKPLDFIAQINLSTLRKFPVCEVLANDGLLLFFYATESGDWGFDPKDSGSSRVIFINRMSGEGVPVLQEHGQVNTQSLSPCELQPRSAISIPSREEPEISHFELTYEERDCYCSVADVLSEHGSLGTHQLLGWPAVIQNPMQLECQLVTNGIYCGDPSGYADARRAQLEAGASDWRLLFQIDSDDNADAIWGDGGRLYYWIREEDLLAKNFDRTWMVFQCH